MQGVRRCRGRRLSTGGRNDDRGRTGPRRRRGGRAGLPCGRSLGSPRVLGMGSTVSRHHRRFICRIDYGHHAATRCRSNRSGRHGHAFPAVSGRVDAGRPYPAERDGTSRPDTCIVAQTVASAVTGPPVKNCTASVELPARCGGHDHAPGRIDRPHRSGRSAPYVRRRSLARRSLDLRGAPGRWRSRGVRPGRLTLCAAGRRRPCLVFDPRLLRPGCHRRGGVFRRWRPFADQRRRPSGSPLRGGCGHLAHVGRVLPVAKARRPDQMVGPPPARTRSSAPRGRRLDRGPRRAGPTVHRRHGVTTDG